MATSPLTSASYSLREREPTPSDRRASGRGTPLRDRNIVVIDGKRFRMQIRHKATGEIVTVPPHIWENIRPATEETFNRLVEAAKTTGNHNNFKAEHIQKIQIDLSSEPYTIRYTSKASADTEEELEEATEFTLDVSPTNARVHQHAIRQFGAVSHVVSASMAPPRPIRMSSPSDEERTVRGSRRSVGHSIEATIGRLRGGETLTSDDLMNYTHHVIKRHDPRVLLLERNIEDPQLLQVDSAGKVKIFADSSEREQGIKREFERGNREAPLVIYLHHGERNQHFSVLVAKDGKLFAYNPTGAPHSSLNLKAIYKGIYNREAGSADICDYAVKPKTVQILHTVYETFKTGDAEADAEMRQKVWSIILMADQDTDASRLDLVEAALYVGLGDRFTAEIGEAVAQAKDSSPDMDTKIKNMIKAAGINAGQVDAHFANQDAVTTLGRALTHQTDGVSCGPLVLMFASQICTPLPPEVDISQIYHGYVSIPGSVLKPAEIRQHLADTLAEVRQLVVSEEERASRLLTQRDIPQRRVIGTASQFGVHAGLAKASCAVMSLVTLEQMRLGTLGRQEDIDAALVVGSELYGKVIGRIAHHLITERDGGEEDAITNFFAGLERDAPVLPAESPGTHERLVAEALHGMHLHWGEIARYLPEVADHDLSDVLDHYNITPEVTARLGGDQTDEARYRALIAPLVAAASADQPAFGLLTLGGETYAVRAFVHEGHPYIDFVNTHGEAQLGGKAAKRTFTADAFIEELKNRRPQIEPREHNQNLIGLVLMRAAE